LKFFYENYTFNSILNYLETKCSLLNRKIQGDKIIKLYIYIYRDMGI